MSTTGSTPQGATPKSVLASLMEVNGYVTLAVQLGEVIVPLAKGLVREIRQITTGSESVTYQVLIQTDTAELDAIEKLATDDLAAINAELAKLGKPAVAPPAPPTAA